MGRRLPGSERHAAEAHHRAGTAVRPLQDFQADA
jgi:hypothetical protein